MELSEIFMPSHIKIDLSSKNKEELFDELVSFLAVNETGMNVDEVTQALWARERMLNTVIAPSIALPHASLRKQQEPIGVFGLSREGIDYGDSEGKRVHIVMMLIDNRFESKRHLKTLRSAALLIGSPNFYSKVMRCSTADEVHEVILEVEEMQRV
ncbi:MAG TPA: PTS sugar transporter subunit IIA [Spirochaetia bacterium]|nr:PTS sugar transporter subunit IIA [Spirochaetia bacterium]